MIGPNLPKNISTQITILLPNDKVVVKFALKPTVPKAEKVSNNKLSVVALGLLLSKDDNKIKPSNNVAIDKNNKVIALIIDDFVNSRLNAVIFLPCKNLTKQRMMIKIVVVLIPPAVEIGDPPININKQDTALPAGDKAA